MAEKEEPNSRLDAFLERIPILDGGGRRRLTAGTIVLVTTLAVITDLWAHIKGAIATKDASLSIFLAVGALLIYAVGVLVELIGEIFLARAVANAAWSFVEAARYAQRWRRYRRPLAWMYIVYFGTLRACLYFASGALGSSRWRMRFRNRLSIDARRAYDRLPSAVRLALKHSLGSKAEFGRMALIEQLATPRRRRWARMLMERPKDVLALVSALVVALAVFLVWTPITPDVESATAGKLRAYREEVMGLQKSINAARESVDLEKNTDPKQVALVDVQKQSSEMLIHLLEMLSVVTDTRVGVRPISLMRTVLNGQMQFACRQTAMTPTKLSDPMLAACIWLQRFREKTLDTVSEAYREIDLSIDQQFAIRIACGIAALFLYLAFFNTLTSATISVIEAIGLEVDASKTHTLVVAADDDISSID